MKNLLLLFISCFLLLQGSDVIAQTDKGQVKNDLIKENLKGKIKSIIETNSWGPDSMVPIKKGHMKLEIFIKYDTNGNVIEDRRKNVLSKDTAITNYTNVYDQLGFRIKQISKRKSNTFENQIVSKFDSFGNLIEYIDSFIYNSDSVRNYDKIGSNTLISRTQFSYDKNNNVIKECYYSLENKSDVIKTYKYDSVGNKIEDIQLNLPLNLCDEKNIYKYDNNCHLIEAYNYCLLQSTNTNLISYSFYNYDNNGNLDKVTGYDSLNRVSSVCTYEYDSIEHITKIFIKEYGFNPYSCKQKIETYKYDKLGNWIFNIKMSSHLKCTEKFRCDYIIIDERKIEYY